MKTQINKESDIAVIILLGSRDFGRCPIATRLPVSLWPVVGRPAVERVVKSISAQGFKRASVCYDDEAEPFITIKPDVKDFTLTFHNEPLRVGTAGSLRDAVSRNSAEIFLIIPASIINMPDIDVLIRSHLEQKADITVVLNPGLTKSCTGSSSGIYVCDKSILQYIPEYGYCDIKEGLIPEVIRHGRVVKSLELMRDVGNFRDGPGYLRTMANFLASNSQLNEEVNSLDRREQTKLWVDNTAQIDPEAKLFGPVAVLAGARIAANATIFGPAIIGEKCSIAGDSFIAESVLWNDSKVGSNCEVRNCLLDSQVSVPAGTIVRNKVIPFKLSSFSIISQSRAFEFARRNVNKFKQFMPGAKADVKIPLSDSTLAWKIWAPSAIVIFAAFFWSYWQGISNLWNVWLRSDEYSIGLLVPFLAGYILWSRMDSLKKIPIKPAFWGFGIFLLAEALRYFGLFFTLDSALRISVILAFASIVLILLGWQFFKKTFTVMLFLCLMLPWPVRVQEALALPLQEWATSSAVFCLEIIGYEVSQDGNIIHIGQATVAVAEACNGLRMITAFFVISALVVFFVKRQWWEKLVILLSSLPIALLCNTVRLTLTAIAFTTVQGKNWERIFHDFGGYAMMPLAVVIVVLELWLLGKLTEQPDKSDTVIITRR